MTFHTWTLLYLLTAMFSAGVGIYFLHSEKRPVSRLCLASILFIMTVWAVLDFVATFVDDTATSTLVIKTAFIVLGFVPFLFFLIPYAIKNEINKINNKILLLFIIPISLAFIVLFTDNFTTIEYFHYGYHLDYNLLAVVIWSAIFIGTAAYGFYLFYKIYSDPSISDELRIKVKYFCIGCVIALCTAFGLNVFLMILYDIPSLGAIFTSAGVGIVFLSFRF